MALNLLLLSFSFSLSVLFSFSTPSESQVVPAMFVFGDSLVDVGNNNYLSVSLNKVDFPPYGIDFPSKVATGRFSNGKNTADFLAVKVGLPTSPPYLSLESNKNRASLQTGVSFASGGARIIDDNAGPLHESIHLTRQVDFFSQVHAELKQQLGSSGIQELLSKSLFPFVIGSNDMLGYFRSNHSNPQDFVDSLSLKLSDQLKRVYGYGARKFVMVGLAAIGCCPSVRKNIDGEACNTEINYWSAKYNEGLKLMLQNLASELKDISYSYFDSYSIYTNIIEKPASYGFAEVKTACCGLGHLRAQIACQPLSLYCANRNDHVFWDASHPTEACARIIMDNMFHGSSKYTYPMNVKTLAGV